MVTRERLHQLLKELPDDELPAVKLFIQLLTTRDPMFLALASALWDDEPVTEEEEAAVREAKEKIARGEVISDEEVWRQLGHEPRKENPLEHARAD